MAVNSRNPSYATFYEDWVTMGDCYAGERCIKDAGTRYLPATSGQIEDGQGKPGTLGEMVYQAYKTRALFPSTTRDAVESLLGIMHRKPPDIKLPAIMEPLRKVATTEGESLELLLRRMNEAQLVKGRLGIMGDLPPSSQGTPRPYIAVYDAKSIINWDNGSIDNPTSQNLNLVVLDETENVRVNQFEWQQVEKYRVLVLGDIVVNEAAFQGTYSVQVVASTEGNTLTQPPLVPNLRGNTLREIPFVIVNSKDITVEPDAPPLLGLANLCLAIYRGEADLRQALFMQGQDTLVVIGAPNEDNGKPTRVGANSRLDVPFGGDAKYIGVSSQGLSEMRHVLENDKKIAALKGAQLIDTTSRQRESGDALQIRVAAQTATLTQIALAGAAGLQSLLRIIGKWYALSDAEVQNITVTPNMDFTADVMTGGDLVEFMTAKNLGAPISLESIHRLLKKRGMTDLDFETEIAEIEEEPPLGSAHELPLPGSPINPALPKPPSDNSGS